MSPGGIIPTPGCRPQALTYMRDARPRHPARVVKKPRRRERENLHDVPRAEGRVAKHSHVGDSVRCCHGDWHAWSRMGDCTA